MDISLLGATIATAAGSAVTALITSIFYRSVNEAKVKSIIADTYDRLIGTLTNQVRVLEDEVGRLRARLDTLYQKELQHLQIIAELTKERNELQRVIIEKENKIQELEKVIIKK